eukprot:tig00021795_g23536.t2
MPPRPRTCAACFLSLYDACGLALFLLRTATFKKTLPRPVASFDDATLSRIRARLAARPPRRLHREPDCAVLVPLVTVGREKEPALLFTRRPVKLRSHAGQVCFPGGRRDAEDGSLEECALRELEEEVGVPRARVQLLGAFHACMTLGSGHVVSPVLGWLGAFEDLKIAPSPDEVDAVFATRLCDLADPAFTLPPTLASADGPVFRAPPRAGSPEGAATPIWGMTARLTWEVLDGVLSDPDDPTAPRTD